MITPELRLERQAEALAKAQRQWLDAHGASPAPQTGTALTIAITREAGTPGTLVARSVAARLGWAVYDRELVEKIGSEMGLRADLLDTVDEKQKSFLLECVEAMTAEGPITEAKFVRFLVQTLLSLGAIGHSVIVGRGAAFVLPPGNTLRVRLVAALDDRIEAITKRMNLSVRAAAQWVSDKDRERTQFIKDHFGKDATLPSNYDLVLNVSRWSIPECTDLILQAKKTLEKSALILV